MEGVAPLGSVSGHLPVLRSPFRSPAAAGRAIRPPKHLAPLPREEPAWLHRCLGCRGARSRLHRCVPAQLAEAFLAPFYGKSSLELQVPHNLFAPPCGKNSSEFQVLPPRSQARSGALSRLRHRHQGCLPPLPVLPCVKGLPLRCPCFPLSLPPRRGRSLTGLSPLPRFTAGRALVCACTLSPYPGKGRTGLCSLSPLRVGRAPSGALQSLFPSLEGRATRAATAFSPFLGGKNRLHIPRFCAGRAPRSACFFRLCA